MNGQEAVSVRGVPVAFPYCPYPTQLRYMEKVMEALQKGENALLESPTGSGKTLCLLCATLAWRATVPIVATTPGQVQGSPPLIIYASRTHSQLQQALGQLKITAYRPRVAIIASRDALCVHPKLAQEYSGAQLNQQCQALCTTRKCAYLRQLDEFGRANPHLIEDVFDIEDLVYIGEEHEVCPYFLALDRAKSADFLFIPYNYLVDPALRNNLNLDRRLDKAVVIFDEAHNMESSCTDSASFDLTALDLSRSILDADFCASACAQANWTALNGVVLDPEHIVSGALLVKEQVLHLEEAVNQAALGSDKGVTHPGTFILALMKRAEFDLNDLQLDRLLEDMITICSTRNEKECCLRKLREALALVRRAVAARVLNHYRVHIREEGTEDSRFSRASAVGRTLSFWCFSSGVTMTEFVALGAHSLMLTSGTLSPLPALRLEMEVAFPVVLENEHVLGADQLYLGLVRTGPSGLSLNSSFKNRARPECVAELGAVVARFAQVIPDGLLVFFPSYPALAAAMDGWKTSPVMNVIEACKKVVVEPRQSSELKACLAAYREAIDQGHGAILMAVCRGKISEGVDFSDRAARGVIVCGLPFANTQAPRVRLKRSYLDAMGRTPGAGAQWYQTQAWRAVNQAVGRVVRHSNDFGAILLCDERFCSDNGAHLSLWLRRFIQRPATLDEAAAHLRRFFDRPFRDASAVAAHVDRASDVRFSRIRPIASRSEQFRLRMAATLSTDAPDSNVVSRPIKVRSRDWGQHRCGPVSEPAVTSNPAACPHPTGSVPRLVPNLLARSDSGIGRREPAKQAAADQGPRPGAVVVRSQESAQRFLAMLKSSAGDVQYKPISAAIRDATLLKREDGPDPQRVRDTLQRLYDHIDQVADVKRLRLHDRMKDFLPSRFRDVYVNLVKRSESQNFKRMIKLRNADSYQKFAALLKGLTGLYNDVRQRDQLHVNRTWTESEKDQFRRYCRDLVHLLQALDRTWPRAFLVFIYKGPLTEIYNECLVAAEAEADGITGGTGEVTALHARLCQFCESEAVVATRSIVCRHVGCWECWIAHVQRSKACLCNQPVTKGKLERILF